MDITEKEFTNKFVVFPNLQYFWGEVRNGENCLDVVDSLVFDSVAEIHLIRIGGIAFRFLKGGYLESITQYRTTGSGSIPDHVMKNHDDLVELQGKRISFANFIAAAMFSRLAAIRHTSLSGVQYVGMEKILSWGLQDGRFMIERGNRENELIDPKLHFARTKPNDVGIISPSELTHIKVFIAHLEERQKAFEFVDLQTCMVMNYQAAILHNEQHAAASVALNFAVAEALVNEIFYAYGLVGARKRKEFASRQHSVEGMSRRKFKDLRADTKISMLVEGKLIHSYLGKRLQEMRQARNNLMHRAGAVTVNNSGEAQTVVRDLWELLLDHKFELMMGWSMRI